MTGSGSVMMAQPPRLWRRLSQLLIVGGQVVLAFMALTIFYDAMMRHFFAMPTSWSLEINQFLLVYLGLATAGEIQRSESHIRIEFFASHLPWRLRTALEAFVAAVGVVFCAVLAWRGGIIAWQAFEYGERVSSAFGTPLVFPYSIIPLGFTMLGIQFAIQFVAKGHAAAVGDHATRTGHGDA